METNNKNEGKNMDKFTINTDSITATIEAQDKDDAARKFAVSENIQHIGGEDDLAAHYEASEGWARVNMIP